MGGGTAIRLAGTRYSGFVDAYLLLAPAISPKAPVNVPAKESTNLASVGIARLIGLMILNSLGIKWFNPLTVLVKNKPEDTGDGIETTAISYRLAMSRMPDLNYEKSLKAITKPALLLIGEDDEEFKAKAYAPLFQKYNNTEVRMLPKGISHDSMLLSEHTYQEIHHWMEGLSSKRAEVVS